MPTSAEVFKLLEDELNGNCNEEHTIRAENADSIAPESNFIDLALKLDGGDGPFVQLDGLPPIDFDASFTDLLGNQHDSKHVKYLEGSTVAARKGHSAIAANDYGIENAISTKTTNVADEARGVTPMKNAEKYPCSTQGFGIRGGSNNPGIDVSQSAALQFPAGAWGSLGSHTIPKGMSSPQLISAQEDTNAVCAYMSHSEHTVPTSQVVLGQAFRNVSSEPLWQTDAAAVYLERQTYIQHERERVGLHNVRHSVVENHCRKGLGQTSLISQSLPKTCPSACSGPLQSLDQGQLVARMSSTLSTQTNSTLTEGQKASKTRYSKGAAPSHYCHICGRNSRIEFAKCYNLNLGLCRKVICEKCLILYEPDSRDHALDPNSDWNCTHCREKCPERARCKQYTQNNQKRREKKARERQERASDQQTTEKPVTIEGTLVKDNDGASEASPASLSGQIERTRDIASKSSVPDQLQHSWPLSSSVAQVEYHGIHDGSKESEITMLQFGEIQASKDSDFFTASTLQDLQRPTNQVVHSARAFQTRPATPQAYDLGRKSALVDRISSIGNVLPQQLATVYDWQQTPQSRQIMNTGSCKPDSIEMTLPNRGGMAYARGEESERSQLRHVGREVPDMPLLRSPCGQERGQFPQNFPGNIGNDITGQLTKQDDCTQMALLKETSPEQLKSESLRKRERDVEDRQREEVVRRRLGQERSMSPVEEGSKSERIFAYQRQLNGNSIVTEQGGPHERAGKEELVGRELTNALQSRADTVHALQRELKDNRVGGLAEAESGAVSGQQAEESDDSVSPTGVMNSVFKGDRDHR